MAWAARPCGRKPSVLGPNWKVSSGTPRLREPPVDEHEETPGLLVVEINGVMVRYRDRHLDGTLIDGEWHEVKLGVPPG